MNKVIELGLNSRTTASEMWRPVVQEEFADFSDKLSVSILMIHHLKS